MSRKKIAYQVTIIDKEPVRPPLLLGAISGLFHTFLAGSAVALSKLSYRTKSQLQPYPDKIAVGAEAYTVAFTQDNKAISATAVFSSEGMARDFMLKQVAANPSLAGSIYVLPSHEVNP